MTANSNDNVYCYPCLHCGKDQCQVMVIGYGGRDSRVTAVPQCDIEVRLDMRTRRDERHSGDERGREFAYVCVDHLW